MPTQRTSQTVQEDTVQEEQPVPLSIQLENARKQLELLTVQVAQQVAAEKEAAREAARGTPEERMRTLELYIDHIMFELRNLGGHFHPEWTPPA